MSFFDFLIDPAWDQPIYKMLARNDTGQAPGHQGGILVPKELRPYFPGLSGHTSAAQPTIEKRIEAELFVGARYLQTVNTRYQIQTWTGTRSPEARLTSNLGSIREDAAPDDFLIIQRCLTGLDMYRLVWVPCTSPVHAELMQIVGSQRWGVLFDDAPLSDDELRRAQGALEEREQQAFTLFDLEEKKVVTRTARVARDIAFRHRVLSLYERRCCVCDLGLRYQHLNEAEAAHIVPRSLLGADDPRNGVVFCRTHHWAFDRGFFGFDESRTLIVSSRITQQAENLPLQALEHRSLRDPTDQLMKADTHALTWHFENILIR